MSITDEDDKQHVVIGEAAMNLIFSREEVSLGSLINQLQAMAGAEKDDDRLQNISEARKWLLGYKKGSIAPPSGNQWLSSAGQHSDPTSKDSDITLSLHADADKPKR